MNSSYYFSYLSIETKFLLQSLTTDDAGNYICEVRRKNWKCWFFTHDQKRLNRPKWILSKNDWLIPAILFYLTSVAFQVENEGEPILQTNTLQILGDTKLVVLDPIWKKEIMKVLREVSCRNVRNMLRRRARWSREVEEGVGGEVGPINHFLLTPAIFHQRYTFQDNISCKIFSFKMLQELVGPKQ